jgi:Flp pilus assembly protein TadD
MKKLLILTLASSMFLGNLSLATQSLEAQTTATSSSKSTRNQYDMAMKAGYNAYDKKDYKTALSNFKRALSLRPNNKYATKAIQNTEKRLAGK